ncbi:hypothetical protein, partial [Escherichia coli]|uniref:hypothetical protein n=1 Tax=Escherichia coli TaxID=562 RepID=UPI00195324D0
TGVQDADRITVRPTPLHIPPIDDHPTLPAAKTNAVNAAILYPRMSLGMSDQQMKTGRNIFRKMASFSEECILLS